MEKGKIKRLKLPIIVALALFILGMWLAWYFAPDYSACITKKVEKVDTNLALVTIKVDFNEFSNVNSLLVGDFFPQGSSVGMVSAQPIMYQPATGKIVWLFWNAKDAMPTRDKTIKYILVSNSTIDESFNTKGYAITAIAPGDLSYGYNYKVIGEKRVCI